ncbi:MAG: GyrI-like domain-containing protein [Coriobacteriia bacterium]|nr:GyrI-like domain-containing protein [Coriobacteriia bacterium]
MMVSIQNKKPAPTAFLPMRGPYDQTADGFARLDAWIGGHGLKAVSVRTGIYYNIASDPSCSDAVWELQIQLRGTVAEAEPDESGIGVKLTPEMKVASAIHKGSPDTIATTYQALWAWIDENGYELAGPPQERYLNDPAEVEDDECLTEVIMPISRL